MKLSNQMTCSQRGRKEKEVEKKRKRSGKEVEKKRKRSGKKAGTIRFSPNSYGLETLWIGDITGTVIQYRTQRESAKKTERQKIRNSPQHHHIEKNHTCTSRYSPDAKITHVAIASIISGAVCPLMLYSKLPLLALKILGVWKQ